jgi:hypothetical protein
MRKLTLYMNDRAYKASEQLPRTVSISALVRWVLIALVTPEKELHKLVKESEEARSVAKYLKIRLGKFLDIE